MGGIFRQEFLRSSIRWMCLLEVVEGISAGEGLHRAMAVLSSSFWCAEKAEVSPFREDILFLEKKTVYCGSRM